MDGTSNSTKVSVDIGATNAAKGVIQEAMSQFGGLWKEVASGKPAALIAVAAIAAVGIGVADSIKQAGDYQQQLVRLSTSAGESQANLKMVGDGMLQIARDTGTATQQLTDGMYQVESAGFHGAAGLQVLTAAAQGAKTENADLGKVTDAVTSALIDYHLKSGDAADVTSKMIAAVAQGKTTFENLTGSLHSVLPVASAAHISMSDILGDLASMTVHGMSADQATQNMAEAIRKMQAPTASMQQYLAGLGINAADLGTKLGKEGLSGTLEDISKAIMDKMGPSGKVLISAFNQSKSAAQDANAMIAAMPKNLQAMAQSFANGKISIGDFHKEVKGLPTDQANLLTQFASLENKAQGFNQQLKSGSPASKTYAQALQAATGDATTFNTALMLTGENAGYTKDAVNAVSKAHADAKGNVEGWSQVQGEFNMKLAQLGEIAQTGAIALGTKLLPIATAVIGGLVSFMNFLPRLGGVFNSVMNGLGVAARGAMNVIQAAFAGVTSFLNKHKEAIDIIVGVLTVLFLPALVKIAVQSAISFGIMAAKAIANAVVQGVQAAIAGAAWVLSAIKASLAWTVQFAIMIVKAGATAIVFAAQAAIGGYAWVLQSIVAAGAWALAFPKMVAQGLLTAGKFVVQAALAAGPWLAAAASTALGWGISFVMMIGGAVMTGASMLAAGATAAIGWLLALGPIGLIIAAIAAVIAITILIITHWKQVVQFFAGLGALVLSTIGNFGNLLFNVGKDIIQGLINGVGSMIGAAGNAVKNVGSSIVSGLKNILGIHSPSTVFAEIGQNMGAGLIQGINGVKAQANVAVTGLVTGSNLVNGNGAVSNSVSTSSNSVSNSTNHNIVVQQLVVQAPNGATMKTIFDSINQDSINVGRGLSPIQGAH